MNKHEQALASAVATICEHNPLTRGAVASNVLITEHALVVLLKRPRTVEGVALNVAGEVSILDLIDAWREENAINQARG